MAYHDRGLGDPGDKNHVFNFFFRFNEKLVHSDFSVEAFGEFWNSIEPHSFNSKQMANILHKAAKHLKYSSHNDRDACTYYIGARIRVWSDKGKKLIGDPSIPMKDRFIPQHLSMSLWAFATLGIEPPEDFLTAWVDSATKKIKQGEFEPQHLSNSLWALAVIDSFDVDKNTNIRTAVNAIYAPLKAQDNEGKDVSARRQMAEACLWFDLEPLCEMPELRERASGLETDLAKVFADAAKPVEDSDYYIPALEHKVDRWRCEDGKDILIEADGPTHFTKRINPDKGTYEIGRYNGSTIFQTKLIEKVTPKNAVVLRVPFWIVNAVKKGSDEVKAQVIDNFLTDAVKQGSERHMPDDPQGAVRALMAWPTDTRVNRPVVEDVWRLDMAA